MKTDILFGMLFLGGMQAKVNLKNGNPNTSHNHVNYIASISIYPFNSAQIV